MTHWAGGLSSPEQGAPKKQKNKKQEPVGCFYVGLRFLACFVKCCPAPF
jgi:hypothetical protein